MSSKENSEKINQKFTLGKFVQVLKDLLDTIIDFKAAIIVIITWLIVAQISGYSLTSTIWSIMKLILYPLNLILFNAEFSSIGVPEVFILLIPLVFLTLICFLIIITTED